ncbi:ATP-dependent protease ATPase subunit ClpY [Halolactibacillus alkaliphilus]|uniref:ATP-dependent protease ATPase subunit HslU n=1 Tax=Halolactibacillus alkaliphilus TaxID=442899 RepID=A0A511WXC6_9BACI|nr:ATP-dependent protease ATPase subunit HslU [Halolactibacillus alkaliphilus]GEN55770.1 ATP-dependent protease ATPase subunit ClpY [Halolactibacillus alkaliphilus]GGN65021.1 ATP-dependent protease ATPase subunit ClpY [Halolactibacillus alkaliphilus]SFO64481.1 ATP-dependent HslUV protease ATP-binding subunit HslU [Halolactibacillus alkaliphilus]
MNKEYTPKEIVAELDQYIIGQQQAKRSVAVALRNRYRRMRLSPDLIDEVAPKNILMIGPTGVGKTEIARRLAKLVGAPFIKVEATKFTEVGYVGRDVESMIRDLVESSIRLEKDERTALVQDEAEKLANDRLLDCLVPTGKKSGNTIKNPFEMFFNQESTATEESEPTEDKLKKRQQMKQQLALGELEDTLVTIEIEEHQMGMFDTGVNQGMEQMQDMLSQMMPKKMKKRKLTVKEARELLKQEEALKLIDLDDVYQTACDRVENSGIVFIDEIDKVAGQSSREANISREGVQRDILPIIEGSTVVTKYGPVKTDHILFIAAGAFHMSKPSDLIPELQGRFPVRVELEKLTVDDFVEILTEPSNALLKQYQALLKTEEVTVTFTDEAIKRLAEVAFHVNQETDNIGARRLHTILEKLLEDLSFEADRMAMVEIEITPKYVDEKLAKIAQNKDLSQFIL